MLPLSVRVPAFLIIGVCIGVVLMAVSGRVRPPHAEYIERMRKLESRSDDIEAIVAGHSHGQGVDFREMPVAGYHLWINGSDAFETDYLVRAVTPRLPKLRLVLLPVSGLALQHDNGLDEKRFQIRRTYYHTVGSLRLIHGDWKNLVRGRLQPLVRRDHWAGVLWPSLTNPRDRRPPPVDDFGYIGLRRFFPMRPAGRGRAPERRPVLQHVEQLAASLKVAPDLAEEVVTTYRDLATWLKSRGIRTVFFMTPVRRDYAETWDDLAPGRYEEVVRRMTEVTEATGAEFHDFSRHPEFLDARERFSNEDHLNTLGAREFTRLLMKRLGM